MLLGLFGADAATLVLISVSNAFRRTMNHIQTAHKYLLVILLGLAIFLFDSWELTDPMSLEALLFAVSVGISTYFAWFTFANIRATHSSLAGVQVRLGGLPFRAQEGGTVLEKRLAVMGSRASKRKARSVAAKLAQTQPGLRRNHACDNA